MVVNTNVVDANIVDTNVILANARIQESMAMDLSYVYIMASKKNGTLYVGVTSDLIKRVYEHRQGLLKGFTKRYKIHRLVYFEDHMSVLEAIAREKQIKHWRRKWKLELIEEGNPDWHNLWDTIV